MELGSAGDDASGEEKLEKEVAYAERQLHRDAEKGRRLLQKNRSALLPAVVEGDLTKVGSILVSPPQPRSVESVQVFNLATLSRADAHLASSGASIRALKPL